MSTEVTGETVVLPAGNPPEESGTLYSASSTKEYKLCSKIGDGGMGVVFLARDPHLGRYVAIKRLNEASLKNPVLRQRFLQEARAVAALNHTHVVHIYALGEDELGPYIVMEYVAGPRQTEWLAPNESAATALPPKSLTLEQFISQKGSLTSDEAIEMILKIARTIEYAHSCGIIHRDLKPANILLDPSYEPKIVDFGLARLDKEGQNTPDLTMPGEKLLSLGYSAPELELDASTSDGRADIYSLGAIFYFLLTGRNPRYYREQDVPLFLQDVIRRAMENVREQRFSSASAFIKALTEAASHGKAVAPTVKTSWRCKWCDAVNPISTKFCAECGWDGSEQCLECGAETFVGQQYCSACGADCRVYEHVHTVLDKMEWAWNERHFERVPTLAALLHGFEPAGPNGRKFLTQARERAAEAEQKVARRNRLGGLIPNELKSENYERATAFIEEYRELCEDPLVYEHELREMPNLILARDMARVKTFIRSRDWTSAEHLMGTLSARFGNTPEYQECRKRLQAHTRHRLHIRWAIAAALLIFLYVMGLPFVGMWSKSRPNAAWRATYKPLVKSVALSSHVTDIYNRYIAVIDKEGSLCKYFETCPPEHDGTAVVQERLPRTFVARRKEFEARLSEVDSGKRMLESMSAAQYRQELSTLLRRRQELGDYDGVVSTKRELESFIESAKIGAPLEDDIPELVDLKNRFTTMKQERHMLLVRQITTASRKYIATLDEGRKTATQNNEMELAGLLSDELKRIKELPIVTETEAAFATYAKTAGSESALLASGVPLTMPGKEQLSQLRALRNELTADITTIDEKQQKALADWPTRYKNALTQLMRTFQQSGDFDAWEKTSAERDRFETENDITQARIVLTPEALRQTQILYMQQLDNYRSERDASVHQRLAVYQARLETLKKDYTIKGEMTMAAAVNAEIKRTIQNVEFFPKPPVTETPTTNAVQEATTPLSVAVPITTTVTPTFGTNVLSVVPATTGGTPVVTPSALPMAVPGTIPVAMPLATPITLPATSTNVPTTVIVVPLTTPTQPATNPQVAPPVANPISPPASL